MLHKRNLYYLVVLIIAILLLAITYGYYWHKSIANNKKINLNNNNISVNASAMKGKIIGVDGSYLNSSSIDIPLKYNITWMRFDVGFTPQIENGLFDLNRSGYHIIGILDYATMCDNSTSSKINCTWSLNDWNASVRNAISTYPFIHVWEIYNEPQLPTYYSGIYNGSPYVYYLMLKGAYKIIEQNNSNDTVLCLGGDNLFLGNMQGSAYDYEWAKSLWSYNASRYCTAISLHAYSDMLMLNSYIPGTNMTMQNEFLMYLNLYENLTQKQIWITESGIPSNNAAGTNGLNNTLLNQARYLNGSFGLFLSKPYVKAVLWFHLVGSTSNGYSFDYGLFYKNMTPKLAIGAYERYAMYTK